MKAAALRRLGLSPGRRVFFAGAPAQGETALAAGGAAGGGSGRAGGQGTTQAGGLGGWHEACWGGLPCTLKTTGHREDSGTAGMQVGSLPIDSCNSATRSRRAVTDGRVMVTPIEGHRWCWHCLEEECPSDMRWPGPWARPSTSGSPARSECPGTPNGASAPWVRAARPGCAPGRQAGPARCRSGADSDGRGPHRTVGPRAPSAG